MCQGKMRKMSVSTVCLTTSLHVYLYKASCVYVSRYVRCPESRCMTWPETTSLICVCVETRESCVSVCLDSVQRGGTTCFILVYLEKDSMGTPAMMDVRMVSSLSGPNLSTSACSGLP